MKIHERFDESSALVWYPKVKDLDIPQPKTVMIELTEAEKKMIYKGNVPKTLLNKVQKTIDDNFKLPVFLKTDVISAKHGWKKTCYYDGTEPLASHIFEIICMSLMVDIIGVPINAIMVREFIPMDSEFKAFYGEMPVSPERRYFINSCMIAECDAENPEATTEFRFEGKVLCRHSYWIQDAVEKGTPKGMLPDNWKQLSRKMNRQSKSEITLLTKYSEMIAEVIEGYWSVDFCKGKDGKWYLIDMAQGRMSWHPKDCPIYNKMLEGYDDLKKMLNVGDENDKET